jgi:cytochrome c oxidase subunit III
MAPTLLSSPADQKSGHSFSDVDVPGGGGGGPHGPDYDPPDTLELEPEPGERPLSVYRMLTYFAIAWTFFLFATLAFILELQWGQSKHWFSIPLPSSLYVAALILVLSSAALERGRLSLLSGEIRRSARWLFVALVMGLAFVGGQLFAWRELALRGLYLDSNPGSFFFYVTSGIHAAELLVGTAALAGVAMLVRRAAHQVRKQAAVDNIALYWHFMGGLWLCLLALLLATIQR